MAPGGPSIKLTRHDVGDYQSRGDYARQIKLAARVDAGDDPAPPESESDMTGGLCLFSVCACGAGLTDE